MRSVVKENTGTPILNFIHNVFNLHDTEVVTCIILFYKMCVECEQNQSSLKFNGMSYKSECTCTEWIVIQTSLIWRMMRDILLFSLVRKCHDNATYTVYEEKKKKKL